MTHPRLPTPEPGPAGQGPYRALVFGPGSLAWLITGAPPLWRQMLVVAVLDQVDQVEARWVERPRGYFPGWSGVRYSLTGHLDYGPPVTHDAANVIPEYLVRFADKPRRRAARADIGWVWSSAGTPVPVWGGPERAHIWPPPSIPRIPGQRLPEPGTSYPLAYGPGTASTTTQ
jgi:hypothetical protein